MSTVRTNAILDASGGNTATINSMTPTADSLQGFRNRIINGDMRIDQRNAGAAVTATSSFPFSVDRWWGYEDATGSFTMQRSTTAPTGFTNSVVLTVSSADTSLGAAEQYIFNQSIEGLNVSDLGWGTANAKTVTLSFWVRSSVTGTYPAAVINSASNRSYVSTYTISSANTFEYKTITIPGDTSGTWLTDNGIGLMLRFSLGAGSDFQTTANQWNASYELTTSSCTNLMATSGATFYITGVQLEVGSVATPFERRDYGRELIMCQRYFNRVFLFGNGLIGFADTTTAAITMYYAPTTMRSTPTLSTTGTAADYQIRRSGTASTICSAVPTLTATSSDNQQFRVGGTVASGLTAGDGVLLNNNAGETWIAFSAEL